MSGSLKARLVFTVHFSCSSFKHLATMAQPQQPPGPRQPHPKPLNQHARAEAYKAFNQSQHHWTQLSEEAGRDQGCHGKVAQTKGFLKCILNHTQLLSLGKTRKHDYNSLPFSSLLPPRSTDSLPPSPFLSLTGINKLHHSLLLLEGRVAALIVEHQ